MHQGAKASSGNMAMFGIGKDSKGEMVAHDLPKHNAKSKALKKKGNYSIFKYDAKDHSKTSRMKHNLSHKEMHHELKSNPEYRGTEAHGFQGGRTYKKK